MLTEGWDAQNVTQILGLRAFSSQLLCEQVVGRALRRMSYDVDPATGHLQPEYADIFGVPFEVIPVKGVRPAEPTQLPPSTLVQALPSLALLKYRDVIVSRLLAAIEPDTEAGEGPILPRIERFRPTGSTADVRFRTTKPCKETWKSHVSHVVLDSMEYGEGQASWHLEKSERVISYVKNDRLDFELPYEWEGRTHLYRPDFLVRLKAEGDRELTLILEIKGHETEQDRAKYVAAAKWVRAVNHHGGFGTWAFMVCREPNQLGELLDAFKVTPNT